MRLSFLEVIGFYGLVALAIWGGQSLGLRGQVWIGAVLLMGAAAASSRLHGDGRLRLGLSLSNFRSSARDVVVWIGPLLAVLFVWALFCPLPPWPKIVFGLLGYPLWAFAQEYALLSFAANRLDECWVANPWRNALINGTLFSLIHAPNPVLMAVCWVSGVGFTRLFYKERNVFPLALAHALGGFLLSWIFADQLNGMRVGPAYWK